MDQSLESPLATPKPPHEEVHAPSSEHEAQLDDVIDRIGRMNLDATPSQSVEQPGPSHKVPKWVQKTLESVHPNEVGKTGTKILYEARQEDGGSENNSDFDDIADMDVSYNCDLNLSANYKPTSFEEATSYDVWKEAMQKEYDALIKNGTWKLVNPPF